MGKIKAMKGGVVGLFSEMAWKIGNPTKHGWEKVGEVSDAVMVETEEVQIKEEIKEVPIPTDDDLYPDKEEIKAFLKEKGVKFHHAEGEKKLRKRYDETKK